MARYEVTIDEAHVGTLSAAAADRKQNVPDLIRALVVEWLAQRQKEGISEEFKRLVEESITENEFVLRRFAK